MTKRARCLLRKNDDADTRRSAGRPGSLTWSRGDNAYAAVRAGAGGAGRSVGRGSGGTQQRALAEQGRGGRAATTRESRSRPDKPCARCFAPPDTAKTARRRRRSGWRSGQPSHPTRSPRRGRPPRGRRSRPRASTCSRRSRRERPARRDTPNTGARVRAARRRAHADGCARVDGLPPGRRKNCRRTRGNSCRTNGGPRTGSSCSTRTMRSPRPMTFAGRPRESPPIRRPSSSIARNASASPPSAARTETAWTSIPRSRVSPR